MQSIAQSAESIGRMSMRLIMEQEMPEIVRHITNEEYRKMVEAIHEESTCEEYESITIEDIIPGADITVRHWTSGYWTTGGSYDYGMKERIFETTKDDYEIVSFELFDKEGDDIKTDFDRARLEALLNK